MFFKATVYSSPDALVFKAHVSSQNRFTIDYPVDDYA